MFKDKNHRNIIKLKIAFDFDGTLNTVIWSTVAKRLIAKGHDVWILTARYESYQKHLENINKHMGGTKFINNIKSDEYNIDLYQLAENLGIPKKKILFTNMGSKLKLYNKHKFDLLFDDEEFNINEINDNKGMAVLV